MGYYGLLWVSDIINKYIVTHRNLYELIGTHYLYQYKLMSQAPPNHSQKKQHPEECCFQYKALPIS